MITRRKFLSLPRGTRLRKTVRLLHEWEWALRQGGNAADDAKAMLELLSTLNSDSLPPASSERLRRVLGLLSRSDQNPPDGLPWELSELRGALMTELGLETADWDLRPSAAEGSGASGRTVLPCRVYADGIRSPFNLGSVFRTAECFGVEEILIAPGGASPDHPRARRSAMGSTDLVPHRFAEAGELDGFEGVFALETKGTPLAEFVFPRRGVCVIGSEELGVRPELRRLALSRAGIVGIPLLGVKGSLNVSVAFGILMHAWSGTLTRDL